MLAIGLDVHQKQTMVATLDTATGELSHRRVDTKQLVDHVSGLSEPKCMGLETGSQSFFLARQLLSLGLQVMVLDAFKVHRRAEGMHTAKTDRLDATALAHMVAEGGGTAKVWIADEALDELRTLTRTHRHLVEMGTRLRNQIRALLRHQGQDCPYQNLVGKHAGMWLDEFAAGLPPCKQMALGVLRRSLQENVAHIGELHVVMREVAESNEAVRRLRTICGCGLILALTITAEIGDIWRFPLPKHLRGYSGLVPRVLESADRTYYGPLVRKGNPYLRHALILLAQHVSRSKQLAGTRLRRFHGRHLGRHGPNPAKVALGRKLCDIIFAMLRNETDFDLQRLAT
jgi:transposase